MSKDILFSPFKIKHYVLKNRIGVAPMTRMSSVKDSVPRQDVLEFLVRRAQNGAAIVYTEGIVTDYESAQGYPGQARMLTQRQIDAWKPVVKSIQENGAIAVMQMFHCGRLSWPQVNPANRVIAPSPLRIDQINRLTGEPFPVPDEMTKFDIDHVILGFVETARGAVEAGFDGIEIHGAHGYLVNNFISSYSNQRTDEYGGTVENRFRFAKEVIQAVHQVVPEDRLLTFRISNWSSANMEVSLFENKTEWQEMIKLLSKEPIDAVSVSTFRYQDKVFGTDENMVQITREVNDLPLMICGQIFDRTTAEDALKNADIVLSAKSILLNPNWVDDVRSGKALPLYQPKDALVAYTDKPLP
jgi:2,4-dienoyl-CoA reductase-like NADH-dependent reductase (Old Yellow Enzyme family)